MAGIFMKIINGELPSYKIHEDEHTYSFLSIAPVQLGHALVIPKVEIDYAFDVPEPYYSAVFKTAKYIAPALKEVTGCPRVGTAILGFEVPHFHYHLIPMWKISDLDFSKARERTREEMQDVCDKIVKAL